jgi:hypothetical protein
VKPVWKLLHSLFPSRAAPGRPAHRQRPLIAPWWRLYPLAERRVPLPPGPGDRPRLRVGDLVRLRGKPEHCRRVIAVEWHQYCYQYVYVVETSAPPYFQLCPYWFYDQLLEVDSPAATHA